MAHQLRRYDEQEARITVLDKDAIHDPDAGGNQYLVYTKELGMMEVPMPAFSNSPVPPAFRDMDRQCVYIISYYGEAVPGTPLLPKITKVVSVVNEFDE